ncbi:MAG TPA: hypothetical protein VM307_15795 [Egibacteraceae bacterium]|nr:hypothetical protein [Egibacteraceae bacterium]
MGAVLAGLALLAGCGGDPAPLVDEDLDGPLEALPACTEPPVAVDEDVQGLIAPDGTVVTSANEQGPLVHVTGYAPMTPVQFERAYAELDGIEVLLTENEVYEAELLVSDGTHRNFVKASATCSEGSQILFVVAPEVDAEGLPLPQQATAPPTP